MDLVIEDTNILIDLFDIGLIKYCKVMGIEFHTTGYVVNEIEDQKEKLFIWGCIANELLKLNNFKGDDFVLLVNTKVSFEGEKTLSDADFSVILLAERLQCRLLTADQELIRQAQKRGLQVFDFFGLIDQMLENNIIEPAKMADCLLRYKKINPRADEQEINNRINQY